jgi:hypothetical protein
MSRAGPVIALGALAALVIALHVLNFGIPYRYREVLDALHVVGFAALTIYLIPKARRVGSQHQWSAAAAVLACLASITALAFLSEAAQVFTAREASQADLVRDFGGIAAGAFIVGAVWSQRGRRLAQAGLACACFVLAIWSPVRVLAATVLARSRLPVLMTFESRLDEALYHGSNAAVVRTPAAAGWPVPGMLAEVIARQGYAGVTFDRLPQDWSAYEYLEFVIAGRDPGISEVTLRIHDDQHDNRYEDRFNLRLEAGPQPRRITVPLADVRAAPLGRLLDLTRVDQIIVFVDAAVTSGFFIDDLRLE